MFKTLLLAGCAVLLASSLSACSTTGSQAISPLINSVSTNLPHCHISGSASAGAGGLAGTGTGVANTFQFDCPAQPWPAVTTGAVVAPVVTPPTE